jgi:hypothetical protein
MVVVPWLSFQPRSVSVFPVGVPARELFGQFIRAEGHCVAAVPFREPAESDIIGLTEIPDKERGQREREPVTVLPFTQSGGKFSDITGDTST